jgi:anti-sigma B factor antagonist
MTLTEVYTMELTSEELPDGILKIALAGRMDSAGTQAIDLRFTALTATRPAPIIVDLAQVSFLASIGIRTLVSNAKAVERRGGRMVLAGPQPLAEQVLKAAGIDAIIPIYPDVGSACLGVKSPAGAV